jgi:hypothetical protein
MRLATYNIEWFDNLFDDEGQLIEDGTWSSRRDVTKREQTHALGQVFQAIDADAIMVVEAPDTSRKRDGKLALENFAARFNLRTTKALTGFHNDTQQEIALLYDPKLMSADHAPLGRETGKKGSPEFPRFDNVFRLDLDIDATEDLITFSKPPLEAALTLKSGAVVRLIGVHVKSKAPHGARGREEVMRVSIANRRKQLAQCIWLRGRVDELLDLGGSLIVMGDLNDGPGLDEYEKLFGRSGVEILLGTKLDEARQLFDPHAAATLAQRIGVRYATSRFYVRHQKRYLNALLDYIMVSPDLAAKQPKWHIWHPFDDPACWGDDAVRAALLTASDHFPVTLDIDL